MGRLGNAEKKTVQEVIKGTLEPLEAAEILGVHPRTIYRYVQNFLDLGPQGLLDRRRGNFHRLTDEQEARIVACKLSKPRRSAHWIRNYLKLPVSVEAVRLVLVKYHLARTSLPSAKPVKRFGNCAPD